MLLEAVRHVIALVRSSNVIFPLFLLTFAFTESLLIYNNGFDGMIPAEIGNLRLFQFLAQFNQLTGTIPSGLWENRELDMLRLDNNQLSGPISQQIGDLSRLRDLRLANNTFTGSLPVMLWRLNGLGTLHCCLLIFLSNH